jgi:hypothetical protein
VLGCVGLPAAVFAHELCEGVVESAEPRYTVDRLVDEDDSAGRTVSAVTPAAL